MIREKAVTYEEALMLFPQLVEKRMIYKRNIHHKSVSQYSHYLALCFGIIKDAPYFYEILDIHINEIIDDCGVYFNMPEDEAIDAMIELSNLAAIYSNEDKYSHIYTRICTYIDGIQKSYPLKYREE